MTNNYVVSFYAGTSGRLISNIIWSLICDTEYEYTLTEFNSTHNFSPFATSVDLSNVSSDKLYSSPNIYDYFRFTQTPGLLCCHSYPEFGTLHKRYPDTKTIVISYTQNDVPEIVTNMMLKNGFESINKVENISTRFIKDSYKLLYGIDYADEPFSVFEQKQIIKMYEKHLGSHINKSPFINPIVPTEFIPNVLILNYSDMCNDKDLVLSQASNFIGVPMKNNIVRLYDSYLEGRQRILNQYL